MVVKAQVKTRSKKNASKSKKRAAAPPEPEPTAPVAEAQAAPPPPQGEQAFFAIAAQELAHLESVLKEFPAKAVLPSLQIINAVAGRRIQITNQA